MDVHIRLVRRGDLSMQIYRQLLEAVLDGRLRSGQQLPPTRELARRLNVSRNTVTVAYELLIAEDVVVGRVGAGSFVRVNPSRRVQRRCAPSGAVLPRDVWREMSTPAVLPLQPAVYDFSVGTPDPDLFPITLWRSLVAKALRESSTDHARYGDPAGHVALRAAIARHVGISRAVRADADDVIVTHGAQQAFDLIGRVLVAENTSVAIEDPGYPPVRRLFRSYGARVAAVRVDREGLVVDAIPDSARLVYVTPSHQFPLGIAMSLNRRTELLAWAERRSAVIVEDDYDTEFRFGGRPLDPLQSLDRTGRVIYVGSFSKILSPGLRVGFMIPPVSLQSALRAAKQLSDWQGEVATHQALASFIDEGFLARHIRRLARDYANRHAQVADSLEHRLGRWFKIVPAAAGLHVAVEAVDKRSLDLTRVVRRAAERGVRIVTLSPFYAGTEAQSGLVVGYGAIQSSRIDEGMRQLAASFANHGRSH